jgi:hypothetical protein
MLRRLFFALAFCLAARSALGGAFLQPEGMLLVLHESTFSGSLQAFDDKGRLIPVSGFQKFTLDTALEYGALDWLTLLGRLEAVSVYSQGPPAAYYRGPGMHELGARVELGRALDKDLVFSAQALLRAPGARTPNPAAVGMTAIETDLRLMAGGSFELRDHPGFWSAEFGQRKRGGSSPDELRLELTAGFAIFDRLQAIGQSFHVYAQRMDLAPQSQSHKAQVSLMLNPGRSWSLQAGAFRTLASVNARRDNGVMVALWRRM